MEDLRFDKEGYFYTLVFYGLFYKRNRKHFPRVPIHYRNTCGSSEELEVTRARVPTSISRSPKLSLVFL